MRALLSLLFVLGIIAGAVYGGQRAWDGAVDWWQSPTGTWYLDREATLNVKLAHIEELVEGAAQNASSSELELIFQRSAHHHLGGIMAAGIVQSLEASWAALVLNGDGTFSYEEGFPLTGEVSLIGDWSRQSESSNELVLSHSGEPVLAIKRVGSRMVLHIPDRPELTLLVLRKHNPINRAEVWLKAKLRS